MSKNRASGIDQPTYLSRSGLLDISVSCNLGCEENGSGESTSEELGHRTSSWQLIVCWGTTFDCRLHLYRLVNWMRTAGSRVSSRRIKSDCFLDPLHQSIRKRRMCTYLRCECTDFKRRCNRRLTNTTQTNTAHQR
jgi:hypothetical protein